MTNTTVGSKTKALFANLGIKFFAHNTCPDTQQFAASLVGQEYRSLHGIAMSEHGTNLSRNQQLLDKLPPNALSTLTRPDSDNPLAEVLIFKNGEVFEITRTPENPDGLNYLITSFSR